MRRLMLLRHAKSDWAQPGLRDHDRALTPRGREAAARMGAYLVRHALLPDLIVASPAKRVAETLDLLLPAFETPPKLVSEPRLYEARANALLGVVKETPRAVHGLLVVGHNPGLAELATLLIASGEVEARQRLIEKFPTAALAVIDFALDDWEKLHPRSGRLDRFVVPRALETATD
jgi:phosphohistidine phosphatase